MLSEIDRLNDELNSDNWRGRRPPMRADQWEILCKTTRQADEEDEKNQVSFDDVQTMLSEPSA